MVWLALSAFLLSLLASAWLIQHAKGHVTRYGHDLPQRFHVGDVPRLGGLAMALAWAVVSGGAALSVTFGDVEYFQLKVKDWTLWLIVLGPGVAGGVSEDITQRMTVRWRLLLSGVSAMLALWLMGLTVNRLGLPILDTWLTTWPLLAISVAALAVAGLPHAFNLIDGYNGLASVVALGISLSLAYVSHAVGDRQLMGICLSLAGATAGMLVWNYPRGLIFAGDGGAYFWGGVISIVSVLLVQRHPAVSPWYPMLLLIYPVWETLFSIYRKVARGESPGLADALHLHQLIYRRIVRGLLDHNHAREMLRRNNRTSPYLWGFMVLTAVPATLLWDETTWLMAFCALFVVTYVWAYVTMVRFRVPRWMKR